MTPSAPQPPARDFPRDRPFDSTLALLAEGYRFGGNRFRRLDTDAFVARLMLRPAVVTFGAEAAAMFSAPGRFTRRGALPPTTLRLLQDLGSVATLDGQAHRTRKRLFLPLLDRPVVDSLTAAVVEEWRARLPAWEAAGRITLHPEVEGILTGAVCRWAGVPLEEGEAAERTAEFSAMIEGAGSVGPRAAKGLMLRRRTEAWAAGRIAAARAGRAPAGSVLERLAGSDLDIPTATMELLNVLRPTVAVARFITFAALALHEHPTAREGLRQGRFSASDFANEVRRVYPFFPFLGGRALVPFEWRGACFSPGDWVILDLYATDHDPRLWEAPQAFRPERFAAWDGSPYSLIPQGTGDHANGHRCPGETITIALIAAAATLLTEEITYTVPEQDLRVDTTAFPALPKSRMVLEGVRRLTGSRGGG